MTRDESADDARHPQLVDSHTHLDRYEPDAVARMLRAARSLGVQRALTVGVDLDSSGAAVALAERVPGVDAAVGIHPSRAVAVDDVRGVSEAVSRMAVHRSVCAIGEIGLDTGEADAARQRAVFESMLDVAEACGLPIVLHAVGGHADVMDALRRRGRPRGVVHYFVGGPDLARAYVELGLKIGVGKPVIRGWPAELLEAVASLPLEALLLETDTYPLPGRTTTPADVAEVCEAVAGIRGVSADVVADATTASYARLFSRR